MECEFCGAGIIYCLRDETAIPGTEQSTIEEYLTCPNCLIGLVMLSLSTAQFLRSRERGGDMNRFYLHEDFYDPDTGEALQPKI